MNTNDDWDDKPDTSPLNEFTAGVVLFLIFIVGISFC